MAFPEIAGIIVEYFWDSELGLSYESFVFQFDGMVSTSTPSEQVPQPNVSRCVPHDVSRCRFPTW